MNNSYPCLCGHSFEKHYNKICYACFSLRINDASEREYLKYECNFIPDNLKYLELLDKERK